MYLDANVHVPASFHSYRRAKGGVVYSIYLLIILSLFVSFGYGSVPPHPKVLKMIQEQKIRMPYHLANKEEALSRGINAPSLKPQGLRIGDVLQRKGKATTSFKTLAILVQFSDKTSQVQGAFFDTLLYHTSGQTMRKYYSEISYGMMDVVTVNLPSATGWLNAPQTYSYYTAGNNGFGAYPHNAQKMVEDAVTLADPMVDFSDYDNDGDGWVEGLFVIHAGPGAEITGNDNDIWSHKWSIGPIMLDGVNIFDYSTEPEYWLTPGDMTCGVYAHEAGHAMFGLPDLYDIDYSSGGLGAWSLMAGGSWGGSLGDSPSHPDAWSRIEMGFVTPTVISTNMTGVSIPQVKDTPTIFKLYAGFSGTEYFLVENREKVGFDASLPGQGLLVYHVDESKSLNNAEWYPGHTTSGHYKVAVEQADGLWWLEKGLSSGDAGDPFPGSTNKTQFTTSTTPNTRDYYFNPTYVGITNISAASAMMTADFSAIALADSDLYQTYRTAKYEDWATSVDAKGKAVSLKRKADKVFFKFTVPADSARPLKMDFGMVVNAVITRGIMKTETLAVVSNAKVMLDSLSTLMPGETFQVDGIGNTGKKIAVKYQWGKKKAKTLKADTSFITNQIGLPLPNLVNVGEELFPKGFGQGTAYFNTGLLIGVPQGTKKARSVLHAKYADVLVSLVKKSKNTTILHDSNIRCLDSLGKKVFDKQQKTLPPDKYDNKLFGEALALKLNIAASASVKFPAGLGELTFNDTTDMGNPFNNELVSSISAYGDTMLSCLPLGSKPMATLLELHTTMRKINVAFADSPYTIDTLSFASKTNLKGIRTLTEAWYLKETPGITPKVFFSATAEQLPEQFALYQNYPNPFNPTTTLSFAIGHASLVNLKIYNMLGQEVATLLNNQYMTEGEYELPFDASNLASGVYFYRIDVAGEDKMVSYTDVKRMVLIK